MPPWRLDLFCYSLGKTYICAAQNSQSKLYRKMKTHLYKTFAALLFSGLLLAGCNTRTKTAENAVAFDSLRVDMTRHLLDGHDNPHCNLRMDFTFPVKFADKEILRKIQHKFAKDYFGEDYAELPPKEAADKYVEDYLESYKSLENEYKEEMKRDDGMPVEAWYSYYETSSNEITYNSNDILSYTVCVEGYTGGAHGSHSTTNHSLSLKTGEEITEDDLFVDGYRSELALILVDKIAGQNNVANAKDLEDIGFFSVDEIVPNGNFLIGEEGITYTFNEYEIAAYVVGATSVLIPYGELRHILKDDCPVAQMAY